ncbi:hypothetical protein D3C81_1998010 [compost metagenome]
MGGKPEHERYQNKAVFIYNKHNDVAAVHHPAAVDGRILAEAGEPDFCRFEFAEILAAGEYYL